MATNTQSKHTNALQSIGHYLSGTGYLMLAGAISLNAAFRSSQTDLGWGILILACVTTLLMGYSGVQAMRRFLATTPNPASGIFFAVATAFAALFAGGLLGIVLTSMIGKFIT